MDENARKRKREDESSDIEGIEKEKPLNALKEAEKKAKKQKKNIRTGPNDAKSNDEVKPRLNDNSLQKAKAEKRKEKNQRKKAKIELNAAKRRTKKAGKEQHQEMEISSAKTNARGGDDEVEEDPRADGLNIIDVSGAEHELSHPPTSTASPSSAPQSPIFDNPTIPSGSSSISSVAPPSNVEKPQSEKIFNEPEKLKADPEELRIRLQQRIEELRLARKADGLNGKPARNRQELMEARRRKEEQRKAHKKELRQNAREEERRKRELMLSRGSSLVSAVPGSNGTNALYRDTETTNNFSFGRVTFPDGEHASAQLSALLPAKKSKGPQDPHTALQAAQNKQSRLNALDNSKRNDIAEKDLWLNARKRAHGERIRDDVSLLKKTLKRKDKAKKKSEKEWEQRLEGVEKGKAMRQKKREENLRKRKEGKGGAKKSKSKPKARPGFEGSFRANPIGGGRGK